MTDALRLHPEVESLMEACRHLGDAVSQLLVDIDEVVHTEIPWPEAVYLARLGPHQHRLYLLRLDTARLRLHIEMARASLNRGERPDETSIEQALDERLAGWEAEAQAQHERIREARAYIAQPAMKPEDVAELKRLYRALVRRLHPDVNPQVGERERLFWLRAQDAYQSGDVEALRTLTMIVDDGAPPPHAPSALDAWRERKASLEQRMDALMRHLASLREQFPCCLRKQLFDTAWTWRPSRARPSPRPTRATSTSWTATSRGRPTWRSTRRRCTRAWS